MAGKQELKKEFIKFEFDWGTARLGYLRTMTHETKQAVERIYREEIDPRWLPNQYCSGCYLTAIKRLIELYEL